MINNKQNLVIDTNILVSAVLSPNSTTAKAVSKALLEYDVYVSDSTLAEFVAVLMRPKFDKFFRNRLDERQQFIDDFIALTHLIEPTVTITDSPDPRDNQFLEVAISCQALYLVTGDKKDLLALNPYHGVNIITATAFLALE